MNSLKFEYIWLDGTSPVAGLRSKTKILKASKFDGTVESLPMWSFDGSSTQQAEGHSSDCLLQPVHVVPDPGRRNAFLVMTEVLNPDGTPHVTNKRATFEDADDFWFGFEQEYVIMDGGRPMGFPEHGFPAPQGQYYCAVGHENVSGRDLVEAHVDQCLEAGLGITGINAEVMLGQWEYQCFGKGAKRAADELWISRYLLQRVAEEHGKMISIHPKPVQGDWNGSGLHTNFSNDEMREIGGKVMMESICEALGARHEAHIAVYGADNEQRLTGMHETQSIDKFSFGVSDRGASIRIPIGVANDGFKGYLEDRRPASNADPYAIVAMIIETVQGRRQQRKMAA